MCCRRLGTATPPASIRLRTTTTACRTRRASPRAPGLLEIPVTTCAHGLAQPAVQRWRLLPPAAYGISHWLIHASNRVDGESAVFTSTPGDRPEQPRVQGIDAKTRFRHYVNLPRTEARIRLLRDFAWGRMDEDLSAARSALRPQPERPELMNAPIRIARLDAQDAAACARWDAFVFATRRRDLLPPTGWLRVIEQQFATVGISFTPNATAPSSACYHWSRSEPPFRPSVASLPLASMAALWPQQQAGSTPRSGGRGHPMGQDTGAEHLEFRNLGRATWTGPGKTSTSPSARRSCPEEEANMLAIPRKQRAMVRRAEERAHQHIDANVDRFFEVYADNVHRHGTPAMPKRYFAALLRVWP